MPSTELVHTMPQIRKVLVLLMMGTRISVVLLCLWSSCLFFTGTFAQEPPGSADLSPAVEGATETPQGPLPATWEEGYREAPKRKAYIKGPDVHRSSQYCSKCHVEGEEASGENLLYGGDDMELCRTCHPKSVYDIHVVGVQPTKVKVPQAFPLPGGKITCVTCHDEPSCNPKDSPSWRRPFFLRGEKEGFRFCFECHAETGYEPYNPHDPKHLQHSEERTNNCLFCHLSVLPVDSRRGLAFASLKGPPDDLCAACHSQEPHFGIPAHLNVKSETYRTALVEAARQAGPMLPLGEDYRLLCVSCHDPHAPGLIPEPEEGPDLWVEGETSSPLRQDYLEKQLYPSVRKRIQALETHYGRSLIVREPGLFHTQRRKLLRKGLQENGSLCLLCHNVFEEGQEKKRRFDYRILY